MSLFTVQVTVRDRVKTGEVDRYGNDVHAWTSRQAWAWFEPRSSGEASNAREQVVDGYWLYLPELDPLASSSQVALDVDADPDDDTVEWYQVDGRPGRQPGGFTLQGFVRAALERVTG